jgi:phosphoglucomutase
MKKKGIYLVQPENKDLKIIYNARDAERSGDQSTILKVNKDNIKFGQSDDFEKRNEEFIEIFGNVKFIEVVEIDDRDILVEFKKHLKNVFSKHCMKSLKDGRKMDWLSGINLDEAHNIILREYKNFKIK